MKRQMFIFVMTICVVVGQVAATIHNVYQQEDLQEVVDQVFEGDTIMVNTGCVWENVDVFLPAQAITLMAADTSVCIHNGAFVFASGSDTNTVIDGFKFTGDYGTALVFTNGSGATLRNLLIRDKYNGGICVGRDSDIRIFSSCIESCPGGAIWSCALAYERWGNVRIQDSRLANNVVVLPDLNLWVPIIEDGQLIYDHPLRDYPSLGSVFYAPFGAGRLDISNSVISNNVISYVGSTFYVGNPLNSDTCFVNLSHCTIMGNESDYGSSVFSGLGRHECYVQNCLLVDNVPGAFLGNSSSIGLSIVWPNDHNWEHGWMIDPLFCNPGFDYSLNPASPCWPTNNSSGEQIGAGAAVCLSVREDNLPDEFHELTAHPNPFNPMTTIDFNLQSARQVRLKIYNLNGNLVATLVDGPMSAGLHSVNFDATQLSTGTYFCRLEANNQTTTSKLLLVK